VQREKDAAAEAVERENAKRRYRLLTYIVLYGGRAGEGHAQVSVTHVRSSVGVIGSCTE